MAAESGYMREDDLHRLGVRATGENVRVHRTCVLAGVDRITFGSNVRVDAFTVLSAAGGWIRIGDFMHVGAQCFVSGGAGVEFGDFSGISPGVRVFSRSDDFSGAHLTGPTIPAEYRAEAAAEPVVLERHVVVGAGSVLLPGVRLGEGATVGALSLVNRSLAGWAVYGGAPARRLRERSRDLLQHEARFRRALELGEAELPLAKL